MSQPTRPLALGVLILLLSTAVPATAGLPPVMKRTLTMFDGDHSRLAPDFEAVTEGNQATLEGYLGRLENHLKKIPKSMRTDPEVASRQAQVDALRAKLSAGPGAPAAAPAGPPASEVRATAETTVKAAAGQRTDPQIAREFQTGYNALRNEMSRSKTDALLDPARVAGFREQLAALKALCDSFADPTQGYVKQTRANYDGLATWMEQSIEKARSSKAGHLAAEEAAAAARAAEAAAANRVPEADRALDPSRELDYQSRRALEFFDKDHARYAGEFRSAGLHNAEDLSGKLERLETRLAAVPEAFRVNPEYAARQAKVAALVAQLDSALGGQKPLTSDERRLLERFRGEYARVKFVLENSTNDLMAFQDPARRKTVQESLQRLRQPLEQIGNREHPLVASAFEKIRPVEEAVQAAMKQSDAMVAEVGDVDAQLAHWKQQFPYQAFDPGLEDGTPEGVEQWGARVRSWMKSAEDANRFFELASRVSRQAQTKEFSQYRTWIRAQPRSLLEQALKETRDKWENSVAGGMDQMRLRVDAIPATQVPVVAGRLSGVVQDLVKLAAFQRGHDGKADDSLQEKKAQLEDLIERLQGSVGKRLDAARLPTPQVPQDPKLLAIARDTLALPKYAITTLRGLRLTTGSKKHAEVEYYDGTWFPKDWDEFQAALAYQDPKRGNRWFVSYATFKYFRKAWRTTPQNQWILAGFFGDQEIREANIDG